MATQKFDGDTTIENLTVTGTQSTTGAASVGSPLTVGTLTLADNTTKLTCSASLEANGQLLATGLASCTYIVETTAAVTKADGDCVYTVAGGVRQVYVSTTGAGGPYALTLGSNNGVNHEVFIKMTAHNTSAVTIACSDGTTTLDAAGEWIKYVYDGSAWHNVGFAKTTGPT